MRWGGKESDSFTFTFTFTFTHTFTHTHTHTQTWLERTAKMMLDSEMPSDELAFCRFSESGSRKIRSFSTERICGDVQKEATVARSGVLGLGGNHKGVKNRISERKKKEEGIETTSPTHLGGEGAAVRTAPGAGLAKLGDELAVTLAHVHRVEALEILGGRLGA